jgi:deoxyribodipyrimidine photolyase-related protein
MRKILLIFPNQLYYTVEDLAVFDKVCLIEDSLFFGDYHYPLNFHRQKLILHRASMRSLYDAITITKEYIEWTEDYRITEIIGRICSSGPVELYTAQPVDHILEKRLEAAAKRNGLRLNYLTNRLFINSEQDNQNYLASIGKKKLFFTSFYIYQRKRLSILLKDGKPVGGKWSFDQENRKRLDKDIDIPEPQQLKQTHYVAEARSYVAGKFKAALGQAEAFNYPISQHEAQLWLTDFLENRFASFGDFEDAIDKDKHYLFHSALSSSLNIGLLTPDYVVSRTLEFYAEKPSIALNSVEGFIRQIIGWREFMRLVYDQLGTTQRNTNFFGHSKLLNSHWYDGTTGIEPVDNVITKLNKTAYAHHIERLMVVGNFMLLYGMHPHEIYKWFMELFIDSYDWVMVPNVYGMSQFADGGLIVTKPYFSSSNYILKMSNFKRGAWSDIWDGLFWKFVQNNQSLLRKNLRTNFLVKNLERLDKQKLERLFALSEEFGQGSNKV